MIIVTGAAGFIGRYVAGKLLDRGEEVVGVDDFNGYYDPALKQARVAALQDRPGFRLVKMDVAEPGAFAARPRVRAGSLLEPSRAHFRCVPLHRARPCHRRASPC